MPCATCALLPGLLLLVGGSKSDLILTIPVSAHPPFPASQIPSTRDRVIDAADLPTDLKSQLQDNLTVAGIALAAVVGFQAFTLALTACQCSAVNPLNQGVLDEEEAAGQSLLGGKGKSKKEEEGSKGKKSSAYETEEAATAAGRYKSGKAAEYYEKYGVR